uniref:ATPase cation transporting 13A2 n=1 Tax=Sphaeramia orbicularis TaxID=375764 RepID=A0A673BBF9_9TELE
MYFRRRIYGPNLIDVPVKSYMRLLFEEVLNPFYVFQVCSIILWTIDNYYYYASCILIISILSISISLHEIRKQSTTLRNMLVKGTLSNGCLLFISEEQCVSSLDLVPGDCLIIPQEGLLLPCDAALLGGECLVNESMLTGESVPVLKTSLPSADGRFSADSERRHTLFCGTQLIQAKGGRSDGTGAVAVVTSTGFFTAKGRLVSSILYPQPTNFRFYRDAAKFLLFLAAIALGGTVYSVVLLVRFKVSVSLVVRSLDIVTIVVPPALPAALTTGTIYAQRRLKKLGVFCISPPRINISGKVSVFCFDKVKETEPEADGLDSEFGDHRVLAIMRPPPQLEPVRGVGGAVAIVGRFPFSSTLQRMSVVTVAPGGQSLLCRPETVPVHFSSTLGHFSADGLRVLALGYKPLDANTDFRSVERELLETDLTFLGLLMMKNLVKPESAEVINMLRLANLRTVMVTGDNILTAVNVAKSCGMVGSDEKVIFVKATPHTPHSTPTLRFSLGDGGSAQDNTEVFTQGLYQAGFGYHLAVNGRSFAALCDHFPEYLPKVLMRTTVFARMAPEQKTQLVKELQKLNYRVGMCGDGANDCGALRAADVGVSLSEAEASVASPFTSKTENISCVPLLIREGRCSLVTSFSLFRYMALYSLIQFCSVLILYTMQTNLSDLQFLFCDLVLVTLLAIVMGRGGPSSALHPSRPPASLLALPVLGSLFIHTCVIVTGQVVALLLTTSQDWYVPLNATRPGEDNWPNPEDSSVFALSGFQYIIMAVVVTKGHPHKEPLYRNGEEHLSVTDVHIILSEGLMKQHILDVCFYVQLLISCKICKCQIQRII